MKGLWHGRQNFLQAASFAKELTHPGIREDHKANPPLSARCFTLLMPFPRNIREDSAYNIPQPVYTLPLGGKGRTSASCITGRHRVLCKNYRKKMYSTFWHWYFLVT